MFRTASVCWALCLSALAPAQLVTLPQAATLPRPSVYESDVSTFAGNSPSHCQQLWEVQEVGVPVATWSSLQLVTPILLPFGNPAYGCNLTLTLSVSQRSARAPSGTFAANLGGFTTTVLSGAINLPLVPMSILTQTWSPPIGFSAPFLFIAAVGQTLVVDTVALPGATSPWLLETWSPVQGTYSNNFGPQTACKFGAGTYHQTVAMGAMPLPGQAWTWSYAGLAPGTPGYCLLGTQGVGGSWGGGTLPLSLQALGAPGCSLAISMELAFPIVANAAGQAQVPIFTLPNSTQLENQLLYDQGVFLDPTANLAGLVTGISGRWIVGAARPGSRVSAVGIGATTATAGALDFGRVTTMRFN